MRDRGVAFKTVPDTAGQIGTRQGRRPRAGALRVAFAAAVLGVTLSGCAMSIPLASMAPAKTDDDVTGSITPRDGRFSNAMTDEDWSKAKGAVQAALDAGDAASPAAQPAVPWTNPATGLKGTVARVADAVPTGTGECRAFVATLVDGSETHWYQGQACRSGQAWTVTGAAQWTPPHQA